MKLGAIAVDYDGTIATGDTLDPSVRDAIGTARQQGIAVILVTGRRLSDLRNVAGNLACFDAVVCENGAVLEFPASGRHVIIAHAPAPIFVEELQRRGVAYVAGEVVIETAAANAEAVLASVRKTRRCVIVHEDTMTAGFGAEIAAVLAQQAFFDLDAPIERLAMPDIPSPHSLGLLEVVVPSVVRIVQTVRDVASA